MNTGNSRVIVCGIGRDRTISCNLKNVFSDLRSGIIAHTMGDGSIDGHDGTVLMIFNWCRILTCVCPPQVVGGTGNGAMIVL